MIGKWKSLMENEKDVRKIKKMKGKGIKFKEI